MRLRVALAVTMSAALAVAPAGRSRAGDDPTPDAVLDGKPVRELLSILESHAFRDPSFCDLRAEALKQLQRIVGEGGDGLRDAAVRRVAERSGDDRRRAQLVLAQVPDVPDSLVRPHLDAEDAEVSTWAYLWLSRRSGAEPPPSRAVATRRGADRPGQPFERDPLLDVEAAIRAEVAGFRIVDGVAVTTRDRDRDEEGESQYELERRTLDLDGDGADEHCVVASLSGSLRFALVLRRTGPDAAWEVAALGRPEFVTRARPFIADLDGDGRPDFAIEGSTCGSPNYGRLVVYSAGGRRFVDAPSSYHDAVRVLRRRADEPPILVAQEPHEQNFGGTAVRLVGTCAMRYDLARWTGREFERVGSVYTAFEE